MIERALPLHPPAFWQTDAWPARLLAPLAPLTASLTARRVARPGWDPGVPVFCCGNATLGGAGKTIVALDLCARLAEAGHRVHVLTRGYGGRVRGILRVDPARHDAALVGDEALLLAARAPVWVGADRAAAARAALRAGATHLVMDDGLQNPALAGRHSALVIDAGAGFGNARLFPAGPLRESPAAAAVRCEIAILIGPQGAASDAARAALPPCLPILPATLAPVGLQSLAGSRLHAFAGIGRPEKFFATLRQGGHGAAATLAARIAFPDHHRYRPAELQRLVRRAAADGAQLVTTPKDAVRLPPWMRAQVHVVGVDLVWAQPAAIARWLGIG